MTFGRASPGSSASGVQRISPGAVALAGTRGDIDVKLQREMREHVPDDARHASPFRLARVRGRGAPLSALVSSKSCDHSVVGTSVMPPSRPLGGRERSKHAAVGTHRARRRRRAANGLPASAPCAETSAGRRAAAPCNRIHPWAQHAGRLRRRADGRAEVHHRLREIAAARRQAPATAPADGSHLSPPAIRPRPRTAVPPPAPHCRRPVPRAHRTQSQRWPLRCSAPHRATSASSASVRGKPPRATTACAQACRLRARA